MEEELKGLIKTNNWGRLYSDIRRDSVHHDFTTVEASRPQNRHLNRYRDVYPYDHSRVKLRDHSPTDYINASLVKAPRANRNYILAQGPLPSTVGHFWLTVWQERSQAVLMLNRVMEKGQLKCQQYWPADEGDEMVFEDVGLMLENVSSDPGDHYTVRNLRLSHLSSEESRDILHFHYTTWPDFGVPQCPDTFLEFLEAVIDSGSLNEDVGPPVVHCSAGIGRSGTFCLVDTCLVLIAKEGPASVCIKDVLLELRHHRMGLIQTPDQLKFSYLAIAEGAIKKGLISRDVLVDLPQNQELQSDDDMCAPAPVPPPRSQSLNLPPVLQNMLSAAVRDNPHILSGRTTAEAATYLWNSVDGVEMDDQLSSSSGSDPSPDVDDARTAPVSAPAPAPKAENNDIKTDSPTKCILNNHKMEERKREMELRRRKKEEANAAMESKIKEMKQKAKDAEEWQQKKAWLYETVVPFCVGMILCMAGAYYFTRY